MLFIWIVLGLIGLVVLVVAIGFSLPERFTGSSSVMLAAPAEAVWEALHDVHKHPMTGKMMRSIETQPDRDGLPVWVEDMGHGERITVTTTDSDRPRRLVREMRSAAIPMTSRWEYSFEPDGEGCRLTLDGETIISRGTWHVPIFRVMMVVGGGVKKGLDIQMDMVARTLGVDARRI